MAILMSSFALMKVLESQPNRYDRGIKMLTFNNLNRIYDSVASQITKDSHVLDIGCGTGALTIRAALQGADVVGIDVNPAMLDIAKQKIAAIDIPGTIELQELGVAELTKLADGSFDFIISGLCFSELTDQEIDYAFDEVRRLLKPKGSLILVDEVSPSNPIKWLIYQVLRIPTLIITYILTQTTTHPVKNIVPRLTTKQFTLVSTDSTWLGNLMQIHATPNAD